MSVLFKWVQLSDVHYSSEKDGFDTKILQEKIIPYLKSIDNVDALLITGDYRYAPNRDDNPTQVVSFIKECGKALKVDESKVVSVPGNHDLERTKKRQWNIPGIIQSYNASDGTIPKEIIKDLNDNFKFYRDFHEQLGDATVWHNDEAHAIVDIGKVNIIALNTALTAIGDTDKGSLILGSELVRSVLSKINKSKPSIVIGHHGLDWICEDDRRKCAKLFEDNGIFLYLCGHVHEGDFSRPEEHLKQVNVGCITQKDTNAEALFSVGELFDDGNVTISFHKWDNKNQGWEEQKIAKKKDYVKYDLPSKENTESYKVVKTEFPFSLVGLRLLGTLGEDGIKYVWQCNGRKVESIAFNKRLKIDGNDDDANTSAYSISTSLGCQFKPSNTECLFCKTGEIPFVRGLKAEEIALQSIFMSEYDSDCKSWPHVRNHKREFAFMGQGEPGLNYAAIREAIVLNDIVMEQLSQKVSRYIIGTAGVTDFIPNLIDDIESGIYKNIVTIHFSLNTIDNRSELMPMNETYPYTDFLKKCELLYNHTKTKIGVGLLMFNGYRPIANETILNEDRLEYILSQLNPDIFKIDLCTVNGLANVSGQKNNNMAEASSLLSIVHERGFEGKIFSSFGEDAKAGCGLLTSDDDSLSDLGNTSIVHYNRAVELLKDAIEIRNIGMRN